MENPLKYSLTTRFKDRHILGLLGLEPRDRVLDVGCGIGYLVGLAGQGGSRACGIDPSPEALAGAVGLMGSRIFACAGADRLPFREAVFDKVIFADVIEHVDDDRQALREIARVCKDGARVVVTTPAIEAPFTTTRMKTLLHGDEDHLLKNVRHGYSASSLAALMGECGIEAQNITYTNFYLTELILGMVKLVYFFKNRRYRTQADLLASARSFGFGFYRRVLFPLFLRIGRAEEWLLQGRCKGHCLIVQGAVVKEERVPR
jgi:SAM-dependent methyltransferase